MSVYSVPKEVGNPPEFGNFGHDFKKYNTAIEAWIKTVKDWAKKNGQGELRGEEIQLPVGDGAARYIVLALRPVKLIHLPVYDAYHFQYAHRLTAADIRKEVLGSRTLSSMFGITTPKEVSE